MKAEYNHWYKCQDGQMPEDFENTLSKNKKISSQLLLWLGAGYVIDARIRQSNGVYVWKFFGHEYFADPIAWMLPEPYKEE